MLFFFDFFFDLIPSGKNFLILGTIIFYYFSLLSSKDDSSSFLMDKSIWSSDESKFEVSQAT